MRDIQNLNREHDDKLKSECCKCPKGKEFIWCGCECHKETKVSVRLNGGDYIKLPKGGSITFVDKEE